MDKIILTTPEELRMLIEEAISKIQFSQNERADVPDTISIEDAVVFLKENGYPTSKAKIYQLTSTNLLPHSKFGKKLVFSKKELLKWAIDSTVDMRSNNEGLMAVVRSANRK